jgi:hypothetical protein
MSEPQKTYGSIVLTKRSKQRMINNTIDLLLTWTEGDYRAIHEALHKHREAAILKENAEGAKGAA